VLDLISSDSLNVPSEEEVYRAVLSWVKHDVDSRRQHVPRVSLLGKVACFYPPSPSAWSGWTRGWRMLQGAHRAGTAGPCHTTSSPSMD